MTIDLQTGDWKIAQQFKWPPKINFDGCSGEFDDPAFALDLSSNVSLSLIAMKDKTTNSLIPVQTLFLDFVDAFGELVALNLVTAKSTEVKPSDVFFTGFENMYVASSTTVQGALTRSFRSSSSLMRLPGFAATVTQGGFCSDGCFGFGQMATSGPFPPAPLLFHRFKGKFNWIKNLPYKALLDDSHFYDASTGTVYVQVSYPLTPDAFCSPNAPDLCLLAVNSKTGITYDPPLPLTFGGAFTKVFTNYTVYKWAPVKESNGSVLAFVEGIALSLYLCFNTMFSPFSRV